MNKKPTKYEIEKMYSLGYSMKELGKYFDCSVGTIYNCFKEYNIKSRNRMNNFTKNKLSLANKGKTHKPYERTDEIKKKMSEAKLKKGIGHKKTRVDGYIAVYFPDHPKSSKDGYIMEHDLIMECYIGRWLKDDEVVHHINHIRSDNRIGNLQLMTFKEHARLHMIERYNLKKGVMTYQ